MIGSLGGAAPPIKEWGVDGPVVNGVSPGSEGRPGPQLNPREKLSSYCGLTTIRTYPSLPPFSPRAHPQYLNLLLASLTTLTLQWFTTGLSIMIAYRTPTVGLGCR